jgi:hypothetical protein
VVGGIAVLGTTVAYLYTVGALEEAHYIFFEFVPKYSSIFFSWEEFPTLITGVFRHWAIVPFTPFLWIGILLALFLPKTHPRERELLLLIAGCALVQIIGIALQAKFFVYHYGGLRPLLALTVGWGYVKLAKLRIPRLALVLTLLLGAHFAMAQDALLRQSEHRLDMVLEPARAIEIGDQIHSRHDVNARANREGAAWIANNTPPSQPIYVWGFEPILYELSNRGLASKYIYNVPQRCLWSEERTQADLMRELEAARPSVIVTLEGDALGHVTNNMADSAKSLTRFPRLQALIERDYAEIRTWEDLTVHKRRDLIIRVDRN